MDIKERFYTNLNMIREEAEQLDEVGDTQKGITKLLKVQKRAMKRSFAEKDPKKAAKHMKVANQAYMKLPVALGETEQLDEGEKDNAVRNYAMQGKDTQKSNIEKQFGTKTKNKALKARFKFKQAQEKK